MNNRLLRQRVSCWLQGKLSKVFVRIMYFLAHLEKKPLIRIKNVDHWKRDVLNTFLINTLSWTYLSISRRRKLRAFYFSMLSEDGKKGCVNWTPGDYSEREAFSIACDQVVAWGKSIIMERRK